MSRYFITGVGTNIGKTFFTCLLTRQLLAKGKTVRAIKPVISGYTEEDSDTHLLMQAQGLSGSPDQISPWRFKAPISPDLAARFENKTVNFQALTGFCKAGDEEYQLIEGAGGVMTPITESHTNRDWIAALTIPALLVTGNYLGALSHTLSAVEALYAKNITLSGIVVSASETPALSTQEMLASLGRFLTVPMVAIERLDSSQDLWKTAPDLTHIVS